MATGLYKRGYNVEPEYEKFSADIKRRIALIPLILKEDNRLFVEGQVWKFPAPRRLRKLFAIIWALRGCVGRTALGKQDVMPNLRSSYWNG